MAVAAVQQANGHSLADLWQAAQERLKLRMSQPSFETWIGPLILVAASEVEVVLQAESEFNRDFILKKYRADLKAVFDEVLDADLAVRLEVYHPPASGSAASDAPEVDKSAVSRAWTPRATKSNLNPRYLFENFVVGQHNRFCHAAALAVAETPAQSYNPFFIYGGVGLGKSHLIHSIGHFIHRHHPDLRVRYVTAEQFTNDLINALRSRENSIKDFRDRYRRNDVLMIDDIQFLEGKERTQEEVFHTFNELHAAGKQIILSSDRPPKHLARLEDRLRSRFEWGLIADIQPPDFETRLAILQKKAERENLRVPEDVMAYVAEAHPGNIRELEGALNKVAAYSMLTRTHLDLVMAKSVLGLQVDPATLSHERILEVVADYYHLRVPDLKSPSRAKDVSHARQVGIYLIRTLTESSYPKIGESLGGRKHTTVLYACEKVREELTRHPVLEQQIQEITRRIQSLR